MLTKYISDLSVSYPKYKTSKDNSASTSVNNVCNEINVNNDPSDSVLLEVTCQGHLKTGGNGTRLLNDILREGLLKTESNLLHQLETERLDSISHLDFKIDDLQKRIASYSHINFHPDSFLKALKCKI